MPRHAKMRPVSKRSKILRGVGLVAGFALILGVGVGGYTVWDLNRNLKQNSVDIGTGNPTAQTKAPEVETTVDEFEGAFTMLLVGNDDGNGESKYGVRDKALNDVNILLHISADHTKATAISVPRDTLVDIPQCTNEETGAITPASYGVKINQSLSRGGLKCVVDTFRQLTGEEIPYAAMIQFEGVIALSNAVGGVPVCVSSDINDSLSGLNLTAGEHTLQGDQALAFLRTRHGVGDGSDLGRISNQQVFLSSLMRTLKSSDTLSNPKKVYDIAQVAAENMTFSTNLASVPTLASLAYTLKDVPLGNISFLQYPTYYTTVSGSEQVVTDDASARIMLDAVFSDQKIEITGGTGPGQIGSVDQTPEPTVAPVSPSTPTSSPTSAAGPTGTPTSEETAVALPDSVTGQTAEQSTCSRGFGDY